MVLLLLDEGADVLAVDPEFDDDEPDAEALDDDEPDDDEFEVVGDADVVVLDAVLEVCPA